MISTLYKPLKNIFLLAFFIIVVIGTSFSGCSYANNEKESKLSESAFQDGDIIFQTSLSEQSKAIQKASNSRYSHMGIIYIKDKQAFVYEAVQPVKLTPLDKWIERGENGHYVVKRLKNDNRVLTPIVLDKMKTVGNKYNGKNYDLYFEWTDERIYCSELVWKIYKEGADIELGELKKLSDFDLSHPLVIEKITERYGKNIPYDEKVISPASIFNSDNLVTIYNNQ